MPIDTPQPIFGSSARLSTDGKYRYELSRRWSNGPAVTFIMLNPSTADATLDDPTIRKCRGFAKHWQMGGMFVVNLFALRSREPSILKIANDPVGPENDDAIHDAVVRSRAVIAAWGAGGGLFERNKRVIEILEMLGRESLCLRRTKWGYPAHPLYVPYRVIPVRFSA